MKKLFISCPMNGRTPEAIAITREKMKKIAEVFVGEHLSVIPSYIKKKPPEGQNERIWYLGEAIKKMAQADYFIGIDHHWQWPGCLVERTVASNYGLKSIEVPVQYVAPDACDEEGNKKYDAAAECED